MGVTHGLEIKIAFVLTLCLTVFVERNFAEPLLNTLLGGQNKNARSGSAIKMVQGAVFGGLPFIPPLPEAQGPLSDIEQVGDQVKNIEENLEEELRRQEPDPEKRPYESAYCYDEETECGPSSWKGQCTTGKRQSPIDLDTSKATVVRASDMTSAHPLVFNYPQEPLPLFVSHNGHSVVAQVSRHGTSNATLHVEDMGASYNFSHMHFHWGKTNENGSEHTMDGKSFAMEIHLVHYRDKHPNLELALSGGKDLSVAVVGLFVKVGKQTNKNFEDLINIFHTTRTMTPGLMRTSKSISLFNIFPRSESFYRYKGSLTVPNCAEKVLWLMFADPIIISKKQMQIFRNIKEGEPKDEVTGKFFNAQQIDKMEELINIRPIQPLNDREIKFFDFKS